VISLGLLVGYAYFFVIEKPAAEPSEWAEAKQYVWTKIKFDKAANTISSDGSDYYMFANKGAANKLIIYFSGGGVAWNEATASRPISLGNIIKSGGEIKYYFPNIPFYKLSTLGGMLENNNPDNPLRDWNVVYIPYTTGDFHIGHASQTYKNESGKPFTMHYNGEANTRAALEWITAHFDAPEKILIAGESAGGFGAAFWTPTIASYYPDARIYQYADSSYLNSDHWPEIIANEWQTDVEGTFGYKVRGDLITSLFEENSKRLPPNAILLQSNTVADELLYDFERDLNEDEADENQYLQQWSKRMRQSAGELAAATPNYYYYITDYGRNDNTGKTPHTLSPLNHFYRAVQDGVLLKQWFDDAINKDTFYSVGQKFIEQD